MSRILTHWEIIPRRPDSLAGGPGFESGLTESESPRQNKAGHGAVSFGILGANRMAVIAPLLRQLLAHTGVAIHDLSGGRDGRR